jgi:regulatory protein YycI of two-component signal transduction system YycFG
LREREELISESDAVTTLYNNSKIPNNAKIEWTRLGYTRSLKVRSKNVYIPCWFVSIKAGENTQVEMVNAMNNTVITNSTVAIVDK